MPKAQAALAAMYAQRVVWLEREVSEALTGSMPSLRSTAPKPVEAVKRRVPESILALARSQRPAESAA